ncbi:DciA family protein [Streptomyces longwoodensis]|uniref:DciA family protein n=1 Tax=Streptomyces longwoodensis TaxID=68231 RepID=UPI00225B53A5|nr:DciA family protein [Streptomyces longwoodensis]MCX5000943.1 DUF721 domain-containing protein [Streptomyces longwoodensis]
MTDTPQLAGADLARLALQNARTAAKTNPTRNTGRPKPKRTARRGEGRDPVSLAAALTTLGADIPLDTGLAGGNLIDQWPTLCPQYAGLVQPAHYDEPTGRLDLRPSSHAYAAQLRILGGQLARQINDKLGQPVVRSIRVLPVGRVDTHQPAPAPAEQAEPKAPVRTRETAHPGYRAALEAALTHRPERPPTNPYLRDALARQEAALRAHRQPENEHRDAVWELDRLAGAEVARDEAVRQAAITRARRERAEGDAPQRLFGAA